jgi:hypothetical protein
VVAVPGTNRYLGTQYRPTNNNKNKIIIAELKNGGAMPPLPDTSLWRGAKLITHRASFPSLCFTGSDVNNHNKIPAKISTCFMLVF